MEVAEVGMRLVKAEELILRILNTVGVTKSRFEQSEDFFEVGKIMVAKGDVWSDLSVSSSRETACDVCYALLRCTETVAIHSQLLVYLRDESVKVFAVPEKLVGVRDSFGKAEWLARCGSRRCRRSRSMSWSILSRFIR